MPKAPSSKNVLLDEIVTTILRLGDIGGTGKMRLATQLRATAPSLTSAALTKALDAGVATSVLVLVGSKYHVHGHAPPAPPAVVIEDVVVGAGAPAVDGSQCTMSYRGTLLEGGAQFDAASKFSFELGAGEVIKGWDSGVLGMRVGGSRKLTIPPALGYGKRGSPPDIPPNATLVFDIKLLAVKE